MTGWGLAPILFLLLITSNSSKSPIGFSEVSWLWAGILLKLDPEPLKPLLVEPKPVFVDGGRLKPMFGGD